MATEDKFFMLFCFLAMIAEMKSQKAQHEKAILDLAAVTAKHAEEIDRLGMLLDLYEDVPESSEILEEHK